MQSVADPGRISVSSRIRAYYGTGPHLARPSDEEMGVLVGIEPVQGETPGPVVIQHAGLQLRNWDS